MRLTFTFFLAYCSRLRICGSQSASQFLKAFEYYNLWPLDSGAWRLLKNSQINLSREEKMANAQVIYGDYDDQSPVSSKPTAEQSNGTTSLLREKPSVAPPQVEDIVA